MNPGDLVKRLLGGKRIGNNIIHPHLNLHSFNIWPFLWYHARKHLHDGTVQGNMLAARHRVCLWLDTGTLGFILPKPPSILEKPKQQ